MYSAPMMQCHIPALDRNCLDLHTPSTMPCILKNTVCISSPYVVVCMHVQQTCSADTAKPAMLSNTMHATCKGSLMVAPQSILNHSLIPRPSPALFLDHIHDLLLHFLDWMCDLSKATWWRKEPRNKASWTICSDYEFCWLKWDLHVVVYSYV